MLSSIIFSDKLAPLPADASGGLPDWVWIFLVVFLVFLLFGLWVRARGRGVVKPEKETISAANEPRSQPRPKPVEPQPEPISPARLSAAQLTRPDNLEIIEGIGPRIAAIINAGGITTFARLADTSPAELQALLKAAAFRAPADTTTWPQQARLAANGDWEALQQLQNRLKAGRSTV